jgi:hypothetical protein
MQNEVHLVKETRGCSYCGIESYKIYTKKGVELAGMNRLAEVTCNTCLREAHSYWYKQEGIRMKKRIELAKICWELED